MLLLLSSVRAVRAMTCANHSLQSCFFQKEFFGESIRCIRTLTHELREWSLTTGGGGRAGHLSRAKIF